MRSGQLLSLLGWLSVAAGCGGAVSTSETDSSDPGRASDSSPVDSGTADNADGDCMSDAEEAVFGSDPTLVDTDGDGLDDCEERDLGTDPNLSDTDGDGLSDQEEAECASNPLDAEEVCYACGWGHGDPGDLTGVGTEEGDTIANVGLIDACGESVDLWDFAGRYYILYVTGAW